MTLVKICGITNFLDAQVAMEAGADFLGFIFYEKSPRKAERAVAERIMTAFAGEDNEPVGVGVFVDPTPDDVRQTLSECGLRAAQVHRVNRERLHEIRQPVYGAAFAAIQPKTLDEALASLDLVTFDHEAGDPPCPVRAPEWCPLLLADAYHANLPGGTGQRADPELAAKLVERVPRLVLAGGLTPDNVAEAILAVRPWAVDVASGTEESPGRKDHGKVRAFIQAVREVDKEFIR